MSEFRMKRVNELVRQELSDLIRRHLPVEQFGLITVTGVEVAKDLKVANIFISSIGTQPDGPKPIDALKNIRKDLQQELSRKVVLKYTPQLIFREDSGLQRGQQVLDILNDLEEETGKDGQKT